MASGASFSTISGSRRETPPAPAAVVSAQKIVPVNHPAAASLSGSSSAVSSVALPAFNPEDEIDIDIIVAEDRARERALLSVQAGSSGRPRKSSMQQNSGLGKRVSIVHPKTGNVYQGSTYLYTLPNEEADEATGTEIDEEGWC